MTHDAASERPTIAVPDMCERHQFDLIRRRLRMRESDPWQAAIVTAQLMLFKWVVCDERVEKRSELNALNLTLVLAEIGCLACFDHDAYNRAVIVLRQGLEHATLVAREKIPDPAWPIAERMRRDKP